MSECKKVFIVKTRLVKLGKGRTGFYIPKAYQKDVGEYLGYDATLIICFHSRRSNDKS